MNQTQQEGQPQTTIKRAFSQNDIQEFENPNTYTGIGKMTVSTKPTAPCHSFGTSTRQKAQKIFQSKELCKTQFVGKTSPGPNYEVRHTDQYYYKIEPRWSFGREIRNTLNTGAKHAYYSRKDIGFDPVHADNSRRWNQAVTKIGLENRFSESASKMRNTPGPEYNPGPRPEIPNPPRYSIGARREVKGASTLILPGSTPQQIGPGSYVKLDQKNTSIMPDHPRFSFTQAERMKEVVPIIQKNQTYDTRSSIGNQVTSKKRSMSAISMGRSKRDAKTGMFKDMMSTQATRIRIQHPKF